MSLFYSQVERMTSFRILILHLIIFFCQHPSPVLSISWRLFSSLLHCASCLSLSHSLALSPALTDESGRLMRPEDRSDRRLWREALTCIWNNFLPVLLSPLVSLLLFFCPFLFWLKKHPFPLCLINLGSYLFTSICAIQDPNSLLISVV